MPDGPRGKPITRRTLLSRRDAMTPAERAAASAVIARRAATELATRLPAPAAIALYAAKGSEVDTAELDALLRASHHTVLYPRVIDVAKELLFAAVTPGELAPTRFGLREPDVARATVPVADIAAFVIPGLAFDREGGRVGWGRGHYDATLAAAPRALRIGLAFECQVIDRVPHEPHDIPCHLVITETTTHHGAP